MKRILTVVGILLLAGMVYLGYRTWFVAKDVDMVMVDYGSISAIVETTGRVRAPKQVDVGPQVSGRVIAIHVEAGQDVAAGDLVLELYDPTLVRAVREAEIAVDIRLLQLEQAEYGRSDAEIAIATARLRQATIARQIAEEEYDEVADDKGAATSAEALALANAKVNYEIARAEFERAVQGATETQIDLLRAQLEQAELGLEAAETRLSYAQMEAPFEGTVLALNTDVGDMVFARNPILTLADLSKLQVIAQVDEIDIAEIAVGQEVEIVLDAFPAHTLKGLVVDIAPAATPQRGSTVYATTIAFNASELDIRSGMSTNLIIITKEKEDVLLIPNRAIEHIGQADVVQVLEEGEIREQAVELGLSNRQQTEVISGLEAGDIVVVE